METVERTFTIGFSEEAADDGPLGGPSHKVFQALVGLTVELAEVGGGRIEGVVGRVDDDGIHLWTRTGMVGRDAEPSVYAWGLFKGVWVL